MKREYTKPIIVFENFSMSTNIAAGCEHITNNHVENVCGYLDQRDPTKIRVFMVGIQGCVRTEPDGYNGVCYHNPSETYNLFNS